MELKEAIAEILTVRVSGPFAAMLDYTLENPEPRVTPRITGLTITSDGFVMCWTTDRPFKEGFIGAAEELHENIVGLCQHLGYEDALTNQVEEKVMAKIKDWRN